MELSLNPTSFDIAVLAPCGPGPGTQRDVLWRHTRNSLGIARLLVREGRPEPLVETACRTAVENACRAALDHNGLRYDGDIAQALRWLSAPDELWAAAQASSGAALLCATEKVVGWVAGYLRSEVPERSWGY